MGALDGDEVAGGGVSDEYAWGGRAVRVCEGRVGVSERCDGDYEFGEWVFFL